MDMSLRNFTMFSFWMKRCISTPKANETSERLRHISNAGLSNIAHSQRVILRDVLVHTLTKAATRGPPTLMERF